VDTIVDCATNVVSVTWNSSGPGVVYTATARHLDGQPHNCSTTQTACFLGNLECDTQYNVTITPSEGACVGSNSPSHLFTTGQENCVYIPRYPW